MNTSAPILRCPPPAAKEQGIVTVVVAMCLLVLLGVAALVIDLSYVRTMRATATLVSDAAATAGAGAVVQGGGRAGCDAAAGYVAAQLGASLPGLSCSGFPVTCTASTASATTTGTAGRHTVTITYPVADGDALMRPSAAGASDQPIVAADGNRCQRLGVRVTTSASSLFASVLGRDILATSVHAVARADTTVTHRPFNLLVLERHQCVALEASGSGTGGGIIARAITNPATGRLEPALVAVDSDGSASCAGDGTLDVNGSGSLVRADGPSGCAGELSPGTGQGCGTIELFAPGPPGCMMPSCSSSGTVAPAPVRSPQRHTRAAVDHRFNCKSSYPASFDIPGCWDAAVRPPYIDQLVAAVGSGLPVGFQRYESTYPCTIDGSPGTTITVPPGNWYVGCDLAVKRNLIFNGGNVVFGRDVVLESSGLLSVNATNTGLLGWTEGQALGPLSSSANAAYVYFQNGTLRKSGDASLRFHRTMVYLSASSGLQLDGGSGAVAWDAPTEGPFEDLALWSEGTADHRLAGQANLSLEGVFFAPHARITYSGNGAQQQVKAQFVSRRLAVSGSGILVVEPSYDRSVRLPLPATVLLR